MKVTIRRWKLKKGDCLYLDIYHRGQRRRENLDIILTGDKFFDEEKLRMAATLRAKREVELLADVHGLVADHKGDVAFVDWAKSGKSPAITRCTKYLEDYFDMVQIRAVSKEMVEGFQDYLQGEDLADSTVETYMNAVVAQFNRAVKSRVLRASPCLGIRRVRADESPPKSLTQAELSLLRKAAIMGEDGFGGEVKRAFLFACETGPRWGDVRALTYGKIRDRQIEVTQGKTGRPVYVPVNDTAWALIDPGKRIPAHDEKVFPLLKTETDPNSYYLGPWGELVGLPFTLTFHVSRHTFIRALLDAGVDIATVQALAGHNKMETTARYARASSQNKRDAVVAMDKRNKGSSGRRS